MKIFKFSVIFLCITFCVGFVITAAMLIKQNMVDLMINDNVNSMSHNVKYRKAIKINDVPLITQKISCGYACIEMLSKYLNPGEDSEAVTEEMLYEGNSERISTSTNGGFYNEIRKQFPDYKVTRYKNIKNSEMIEKIYESISNNMPVIFSFAARSKQSESKDTDENTDKNGDSPPAWTLHYGVVVGMDLTNDKITINNPYGYTETYTVNDFLEATRFQNYENMEFYLKLGFAIEIFTKNTIYILEPIEIDVEIESEDTGNIEIQTEK